MSEDSDGAAVIEDDGEHEFVLIRGMRLLSVLSQFSWVVSDKGGVLVPRDHLDVARRSLEAAGFRVMAGRKAPKTTSRRMPLPLQECAECHAPYARAFAARAKPGDVCTECGAPLALEQHDPNVGPHGPAGYCPRCDREVGPAWKFCTCGNPLPRPERLVTDDRPWRERFTREANAANVDAWGIDVRAPSPNATPHQIEAQRLFWERFDAARETEQRPVGGRRATDVEELTDMATATGAAAFGLPADVADVDVERWGQEQPPPEFRLPPPRPDDGWDAWPDEFRLPE